MSDMDGPADEAMLEVFGDFDPSQYEDEAQAAVGRHRAPTANRPAAPPAYTKADWQQIGQAKARRSTRCSSPS